MKQINHGEVSATIRAFLSLKCDEFLQQVKNSEKSGHYKGASDNWDFVDEFVEWLIGNLEISAKAAEIREVVYNKKLEEAIALSDDDIPF